MYGLVMYETHMFWAYGDLRRLETIAVSSFLKNGYHLNIWTYGEISNAPRGANLRNARDVLPEKMVFLNRRGSYASFSDLFRYTVLNTIGGLYSDTDVIAITPAPELPTVPFLVTERTRDSIQRKIKNLLNRNHISQKINNNIIFNPSPRKGNIVDLAFAFSERFPKQEINWPELGPDLMTAITQIYQNHEYKIMPPNFANSIDWWKCPDALLRPRFYLAGGASFLHCFSEMWRMAGIDVNTAYPPGSLMAMFEEKYL
jgi:hypothetical protein